MFECEYKWMSPIHTSKIHSHLKAGGAKVNTFGKVRVSEQLMVGLDPESISILMVDELVQPLLYKNMILHFCKRV